MFSPSLRAKSMTRLINTALPQSLKLQCLMINWSITVPYTICIYIVQGKVKRTFLTMIKYSLRSESATEETVMFWVRSGALGRNDYFAMQISRLVSPLTLENSWLTDNIVGRHNGFVSKHLRATMIILDISLSIPASGSGSRASNISLISILVFIMGEEDERKSPGWDPINTSRISTPKL